MIAPHKYLDLNLSLLNLGGVILAIMQENNVIKYAELLDRTILLKGANAKEMFIPTLSFLYLLGKIRYLGDIDSIEYIK